MNPNLNEKQMQAIEHFTGPCLILAAPGSGKTLVITKRTQKLIEEYGVNPSNILVITFTKAAAMEMQERFLKLYGQKAPVNFGTFHAIYFKILKYAYHYDANNILREETKREYIKEIIEKLELELDDENDFIQSIIGEISLVKGEMIDLNHYYAKNCSEDVFKKIYHLYEKKLNNANLIDFDDMLILCYELLRARADILAIWQKKYQYILIDEFQDINKVQYEIIRLIASPINNLFIVGDDDQSIYRFRGAKPEIMLNFEKDYPNTKRILLDTNYRSTIEIVKASLRLIKNNQARFEKNIHTINKQGNPLDIQLFPNPKEENAAIIKKIKEYFAKGIQPMDIAVLYRTNTGAKNLIEKFLEYNIPFHVKDSIPNIYEHWIAKNIFTYIEIALGDKSRGAFMQIANRPKRYIGRESLNQSTIAFSALKHYYRDKEWMVERIEKFEYDITLLAKMNPYSAVNYIRLGIGYDEYLKEYAQYRRINPDDLYEVLDEIQESAKEYKTFAEWFAHIEEYTQELKNEQSKRKENHNSIEIATMHSAKGLEYKVVFIPDVNEGISPHHKAVVEEELEEERRLFYVAVTRAKEKLHIYSIKERHNKELKSSRFIGEILCDMQELTTGKIVSHQKYGKGSIKKIADGKLVIYFPNLRKNLTFDAKYAIANKLIRVLEE